MRITATITSKGQITIPKYIRDRLKGRIVEFVVRDDRVEIRPVPSVAGSLADCASGYVPIDELREATWSAPSEA